MRNGASDKSHPLLSAASLRMHALCSLTDVSMTCASRASQSMVELHASKQQRHMHLSTQAGYAPCALDLRSYTDRLHAVHLYIYL